MTGTCTYIFERACVFTHARNYSFIDTRTHAYHMRKHMHARAHKHLNTYTRTHSCATCVAQAGAGGGRCRRDEEAEPGSRNHTEVYSCRKVDMDMASSWMRITDARCGQLGDGQVRALSSDVLAVCMAVCLLGFCGYQLRACAGGGELRRHTRSAIERAR